MSFRPEDIVTKPSIADFCAALLEHAKVPTFQIKIVNKKDSHIMLFQLSVCRRGNDPPALAESPILKEAFEGLHKALLTYREPR